MFIKGQRLPAFWQCVTVVACDEEHTFAQTLEGFGIPLRLRALCTEQPARLNMERVTSISRHGIETPSCQLPRDLRQTDPEARLLLAAESAACQCNRLASSRVELSRTVLLQLSHLAPLGVERKLELAIALLDCSVVVTPQDSINLPPSSGAW
ncbi:hypothetical protein EON64_05290 [archaeon]|nr:MAG: hypothetical protein EON64_05290 [archaeon]